MNYPEARKYADSLSARGVVPGLNAVGALCAALGSPQRTLRTIHIAGTNGKGSVGAFIANIFMSAGMRVGRFSSPAVGEYREIIRVNEQNISEADYARCAEAVKNACGELSLKAVFPTSFEFETALAFVYFKERGCDICVIECGMGGRLDATNIIGCPEAAVITPVSVDHSAFLGNSLREIAYHKAGIIKGGTKVFSAVQPSAAMEVIDSVCRAENARLTVCENASGVRFYKDKTTFDLGGLSGLEIRLAGEFQPSNAALAAECCLGLGIDARAVREGLAAAKWDYRFEITGASPAWVYDGAHNPDAALRLKRSLDIYFPDKRLIFIIGVFADKDYREILRVTAPSAYKIFTVSPPSKRGLDSGLLAREAEKYCKNVIDAHTPENAARLCENERCDAVVVFGSLSFLKYIKEIRNGKMQKNI